MSVLVDLRAAMRETAEDEEYLGRVNAYWMKEKNEGGDGETESNRVGERI